MISIEFKFVIISAALLLALVSDIKTYKIKNSITYSFMAAGLTVNLLMEGLKGIVFSLQGIMLPVACLAVLYMMRVIGAGDIKLFSAVGAVMGAGFALYAVVYSFICGGAIAAMLILARRNGKTRFKHLLIYLECCLLSMKPFQYTDFKDKQDGSKFHFSIAVASGTVAAIFLNTPII